MAVTEKIRWGIIGPGIVANKMARALLANPDSELLAVASRTPARAMDFASRHGVRAAASYEELLQNPDIDVVYIATTHNFHYANTLLALNHGKHVLVEKVFSVNARQAREMADLARAKDRFLMEAIWTRFFPVMTQLQEVIASGRIGELRHLNLTFGGFVPDHFRGRLMNPDLAGGVTLDKGIYSISFICQVLKEIPCEVKAMAQFAASGVDDLASYCFRFPSGRTAVVTTSCNLLMKSEAMIYGTRGYIDFPRFKDGRGFSVHIHNGSNSISESETVVAELQDNGFVYEVAEVVRCLRAGKRESEIMPLEETIAIMAVMDQIRKDCDFLYPFEKQQVIS